MFRSIQKRCKGCGHPYNCLVAGTHEFTDRCLRCRPRARHTPKRKICCRCKRRNPVGYWLDNWHPVCHSCQGLERYHNPHKWEVCVTCPIRDKHGRFAKRRRAVWRRLPNGPQCSTCYYRVHRTAA